MCIKCWYNVLYVFFKIGYEIWMGFKMLKYMQELFFGVKILLGKLKKNLYK